MNKTTLKDISKSISSGLTPLRSNKSFWDNGNIPWVKTEQLGQKFIYDSNEKITKHALENTSIKLNPVNTLSIAMYGEGKTRGSVSILKNITTTNQACCNIVLDTCKADFEYVYYNLKTHYHNLRNLSSGVRKNLNSNDIKNFEIYLPDLQTQKQIAKVLSDLDAKTEVNNKINAELEAMAKTIYDYWFVQFDFPNQNGKPYKSSGGKMVYNEELKREIPEGWEVNKLSELAKTGSGGTPKSTINEYYEGGSIPWINSGEVNEPFITKTSNFITELGMKESSAKIFPKDTLLMAMYGATAGKISFVDFEAATNQAICAIIPNKIELSFYLKFNLEMIYDYLVNLSSGSARDNLSQTKIKDLQIINPSISSLEKYHIKVKPMMDLILKNQKENQKLAELQDWLLPMLMNGQVRVEEAEQKLGMVAEDGENYNKLS